MKSIWTTEDQNLMKILKEDIMVETSLERPEPSQRF